MEHGLSASSHLLSLLPPIKFWYIWSDISGVMGGWLRKVKIIKRNAQKSKISKSLDVKEIPISSFLWGHVVIWKRKSNPLFSLLSAALALTHFLSLLLPPLNRAPHTVQSKGQFVFVFMYTNGLMKIMQCYLGIGNPSGCSLYNWGQWTIHQLCLAEKTEWEHLSWTKSRWAGWVHAEQCLALLSQPDAESSWSRHPQLCKYNR